MERGGERSGIEDKIERQAVKERRERRVYRNLKGFINGRGGKERRERRAGT